MLYFSSTADQDLDGKGISYAIFINKQGVASGYKMGGLEPAVLVYPTIKTSSIRE